MSQKMAVSPGKKNTTSLERELLQHAAVRSVPERSIPFASLTSSNFGHDFSQVTTRTTPSANWGTDSVSCPLSPRTCPFGGACHTCPVSVQTKLVVNQPGDKDEHEADQMAEQVMRGSEPDSTLETGAPGRVEASYPHLERGAVHQVIPSTAPPIVHQVLRSPGQPLDPATRGSFELYLGHDFSQVRVHTDGPASESAHAVNAWAYTVGRDVVFGKGQYVPGTTNTHQLLAHELTHVVQQGGTRAAPQDEIAVTQSADVYEREAEQVAGAVKQTESYGSELKTPVQSGAVDSGQLVHPKMGGPLTLQGSPKGGLSGGAFVGGITGGLIGGMMGGIGGVPGALVGGLLGGVAGALAGSLLIGNKISVDSSCDKFCPGTGVKAEAKKADAKTSAPCKDVKFNYKVAGEAGTKTFNKRIVFNAIKVKCNTGLTVCGGWSSKGLITLGKAACKAASCGPLASSILHEMVHDWAGWGPPYDKQNVTVPGATHKTADYLDEWVARYVEKSCFKTNPWGLP